MDKQITIPVSADDSSSQLQHLVMALVHAYGLADVLGSLEYGMWEYFSNEARVDNEVEQAINGALSTAHYVAQKALPKKKTKKGGSKDA